MIWPPAGFSFLPEGVGERNPPLPRIGCEEDSGAWCLVVQVLMFWGHGCVRREEQRGERSDLVSRGPRSPSYTPGKPQMKTAAKAPGPNTPPFIVWDGV